MEPNTSHMRREEVDVAGTRLSYLAAGDPAAPPLLLLHGTFWSRVWQPVMPRLGDAVACVALDLPGFGRSDGELDAGTATAASPNISPSTAGASTSSSWSIR
ncbi:alpha/beta fold hydrolase [Arthrobacter sp. KK5.5]|uniref:alpha/beta fold hydrolase n=1 Tax=Arthrobacter sp. KK5.5 TaxID=3373084 RepID=UPI003EE6EF73